MYLPPLRLCTSGYIAQILRGDKRVFQCFEICPINIDYGHILTINFVLKKAANNPMILNYLPDDPATHVTKGFLFTVVNTLDPSFFAGAVQELEDRKLVNDCRKKVEPVIEIDNNMYDLIQKFNSFTVGERLNPRSLGGMRAGTKKRSRAQA